MSDVDFDITNYSVEELINILGLGSEIPLDNIKISERIDEMIEQFEDKYEENEYIIKVSKILFELFHPDKDFDYDYEKAYPNFYRDLLKFERIFFNPVSNKQSFEVNDKVTVNPTNINGTLVWYKEYNGIIRSKLIELPSNQETPGDNDEEGYVHLVYFDEHGSGTGETLPIRVKDITQRSGTFHNWYTWSNGILIKRFKDLLKNSMLNNGFFNNKISIELNNLLNSNLSDIPEYNNAIDKAYTAKEEFIIFFNKIANKLENYKKEEFEEDYYNDDEEIRQAMETWDKAKAGEEGRIIESDAHYNRFKKSLYSDLKKTSIHIDSAFRKIADPIVCPDCPDTIEFYDNIAGDTISVNNVIVASSIDSKILFAGVNGEKIYRLNKEGFDVGVTPTWHEIDFSNNISDVDICKNWVDITMSENAENVIVCSKNSNIWYSNDKGIDNSWQKGVDDISNIEISGNWTAITSDKTGNNVYVTRRQWVDGSGVYKYNGINKSNDGGKTWANLTGSISNSIDLSQNWIDIVVSGDGNIMYAIYEKTAKYYIVKSNNNGATWTIINNSYTDITQTTALQDIKWKNIVTNDNGTKVYVIAETLLDIHHINIWYSVDSGLSWFKNTGINGYWNSITCSSTGNEVSVWNNHNGKMRYSRDGGTTWLNNSTVIGDKQPRNKAKMILNGDGDKILILDYSGNIFTSKKCKKVDNKLFDRASNFTLNLTEPIKNVVRLKFINTTINHCWDVFSNHEGTNYFYIRKAGENIKKIEIEEGSYHDGRIAALSTESNLFTTINDAIKKVGLNISFSLNTRKNKVKIKNNGAKEISIFWYYENDNTHICSHYGTGPKINYNLGWLLGFRKTLIVIDGSGNVNDLISAEENLNLNGTQSLYISLDEFSNKQNDTGITYSNNPSSFNMPSYYVKTTMTQTAIDGEMLDSDKCYVPPASPPTSCGKKKPNPDSIENLTSAQRYTITNIRNAINTSKTLQYNSPQISNQLCNIPLIFNNSKEPSNQSTNWPLAGTPIAQGLREYASIPVNKKEDTVYNPITLRKFHVRLLNERGNEVEMRGNWSFNLEIEQLTNNNTAGNTATVNQRLSDSLSLAEQSKFISSQYGQDIEFNKDA